MIKKYSLIMKLIFFTVILLGLTALNVYAKDYCIDCHKDAKFQVQNKLLYDYYNYWKDSVHATSEAICKDCHGGNEQEPDKDIAHKMNFSPLTAADKGAYKKIPQICGNCHKVVLTHFVESKHYKELLKDKNSPNCVTCHGSMNTEVYEAHNIAKGCQVCHNEKTKISPEVSERSEKVLTQINFVRAYRKWITVNYSDRQPELVKGVNDKYEELVLSWHKFDFKQMEEKTQKLLIDLRSIVNKGIAEKKKKIKKEY